MSVNKFPLLFFLIIFITSFFSKIDKFLLNVDISKLELGDKFYTSELEDENFELLHPENTVVCQVRTSRASMALPEDEETEDGEESLEGATEGATEGGDSKADSGDSKADGGDSKAEANKE